MRRLRDPDERIRLAALSKLIDLAYAQPSCLSAATYLEISERAKDRRLEVRRLTMVGLAKIYGRHVSMTLPPLSSAVGPSLRAAVDADVLSKLEFVPGLLLKCWGYPEISSKHLILQLVQEQLLPKAFATPATDDSSASSSSSSSSSPTSNSDKKKKNNAATEQSELNERRASALLLIFEGLQGSDRNSLAAILGFKSKARSELQTFLKIRAAPTRSRNSSIDGSSSSRSQSTAAGDGAAAAGGDEILEMSAEEQMKAMRKSMLRLMQVVPSADKKSSFIERLFSAK